MILTPTAALPIAASSAVLPADAALHFAVGYIVCLLIPGPNMIMTGGLAALRGVAGVVPFAGGLAVGVLMLGGTLWALAGLVPAHPEWDVAGRVAGAVLLVVVAAQLAFAAPPRASHAARIRGGAEFTAGIATAVTNPVTAAFFAAQFLGPLGDVPFATIAPLLAGAAVAALGYALIVGRIFAVKAVRERVAARFGLARRALALVFLGMAVLMVRPVWVPISGHLHAALLVYDAHARGAAQR